MKALALASSLFAAVALAHADTALAQAAQANFATGFADVVERVQPAVVSIRVASSGERPKTATLPKDHRFHKFFEEYGAKEAKPTARRGSVGSGFLISTDGYVVTNNHVVEDARQVEIVLKDGREFKGRVIGTDPKTDLAVVKIHGKEPFPYAEFASKRPRVGEWVVAVGNPFGLGGTVTAGIVSGMGRDVGVGPLDDFIQVDAPINKGNSGGPTFNFDGKVVGVNASIYTPTGGSVGIAFAIPADVVTRVVENLRQGKSVARGWLGVRIQDVDANIAESLGLPGKGGAIVAEPTIGSPADKAGLTTGDVILKLDDAVIDDARDLSRFVASLEPDTLLRMTVFSKGRERVVLVKLGEAPAVTNVGEETDGPEWLPDLGLSLIPASRAREGQKGTLVLAVVPNGPAAKAGVAAGDVILEVTGKDASSPSAFVDADEEAEKAGRKTLLLLVERGGPSVFVTVGRGS